MHPLVHATGQRPELVTSAWASKGFRWLWTGSTVSSFGSEISELALPLLVLVTLSGSPGELGLLRVAQFLPFLLAALPLGLLVDRSRRRPLMIGADLGRFALIALIPLSLWLDAASMMLLCALIFGAGVLTVLYQMADFAFLPAVITVDQLSDANAKIAATQSATEIGGRGIGGLLVQSLTAPIALAGDALTYLLSAISLSRITVDEQVPERTRRSPVREVALGFRVVASNAYLRALLGGATTFNVFQEVFTIGFMLYAVRDLSISPAGLGAILVAGGAGSFAGAWFGSRLTARWSYGRVLLAALALGNTAPLAAFLAAPLAAWAFELLIGVFFVMSIGIGISNAHAITIRQVAAPIHLRGRVNAAYRLITWGGIPVGAVGGGLLASRLGNSPTMLAGAVGLATATLWILCSPIRKLRSVQQAAPHEHAA
ncbi:MFS transporter [Kribbella sp. NPDC003505]|uniref:MFS transporter n=1 Tax=Kribbella sp. NPDC003505 TaxID=3154448 RepID=UPI0033B4AD99